MTDIQEQTLPIGATDAPAESGQARSGSAGRSGESRPAAKRGSLSTLLLPELQQMAKGLGISTTKMKKSDPVSVFFN